MSISTLIGTRLLTGIASLAVAGSLAGGTAMAAKGNADKPGNELRHELRDQTKADRDEIKDLRKQLAAEYAKDQPDVEAMTQLHERIEAKRDGIETKRFTAFMDMHDELDAKQRERMAERLAKGKRGKAKGKDKANKGERGEHKADKDKPSKDKSSKDKREAKGKSKGKAQAKAERKANKSERKDQDRRPV